MMQKYSLQGLYTQFFCTKQSKGICPRQTDKHTELPPMRFNPPTTGFLGSRPVPYQLSYWSSPAGWVTNPRQDKAVQHN